MKAIRISTLALAVMLAPVPGLAESPTGDYLSAHTAFLQGDYGTATRYLRQASAISPEDSFILKQLVNAEVMSGNARAATGAAQQLAAMGEYSREANLVLLVEAFERGDYDAVLQQLDAGHGIADLVDTMLRGWAEVGKGDTDAALAAFEKTSEQKGLKGFGRFQKAVALAYAGKFDAAHAIFANSQGEPIQPTLIGLLTRIEVLSQLHRNDEARALMDQMFGSDLPPRLARTRAKIDNNETLDFDTIPSVNDGVAEVFYSVAYILRSHGEMRYALSFSQLAVDLRSDHSAAQVLTGDLLRNLGQPAKAIEAYSAVPKGSVESYQAQASLSKAYDDLGRPQDALAELKRLIDAHPKLASAWAALGDQQRQMGNFSDAVTSFTHSLDLVPKKSHNQWSIYYTRGMSEERLGRWHDAEKDFQAALELSPDQPQVLNYYGYSIVDRNGDLQKAYKMISRAAELAPNSGSIIDSLGWVLFKLNRFDEALAQMERATELMPTDPTVNEHLGDVYWATGHELEAHYQWDHALNCGPSASELTRLRSKLRHGPVIVSASAQDSHHATREHD